MHRRLGIFNQTIALVSFRQPKGPVYKVLRLRVCMMIKCIIIRIDEGLD